MISSPVLGFLAMYFFFLCICPLSCFLYHYKFMFLLYVDFIARLRLFSSNRSPVLCRKRLLTKLSSITNSVYVVRNLCLSTAILLPIEIAVNKQRHFQALFSEVQSQNNPLLRLIIFTVYWYTLYYLYFAAISISKVLKYPKNSDKKVICAEFFHKIGQKPLFLSLPLLNMTKSNKNPIKAVCCAGTQADLRSESSTPQSDNRRP